MKKSICLYFQVHQPTRLRLYRFFDIGKDSHYYDDFANRTILKRIAQKCYLPMNELLLEAIAESKGALKVAFSITGSALEQFDRYAPEVIDSFRRLHSAAMSPAQRSEPSPPMQKRTLMFIRTSVSTIASVDCPPREEPSTEPPSSCIVSTTSGSSMIGW